jgi:hypothetical protein
MFVAAAIEITSDDLAGIVDAVRLTSSTGAGTSIVVKTPAMSRKP